MLAVLHCTRACCGIVTLVREPARVLYIRTQNMARRHAGFTLVGVAIGLKVGWGRRRASSRPPHAIHSGSKHRPHRWGLPEVLLGRCDSMLWSVPGYKPEGESALYRLGLIFGGCVLASSTIPSSWARKALLAARSLTLTERRPLLSMWTGALSIIASSKRRPSGRLSDLRMLALPLSVESASRLIPGSAIWGNEIQV